MKFILLCTLLFMSGISINAQNINNGLYVNKERNEFVIIINDTIQFRCYNDDAFSSFIIGEGVLESKRKGKYIIRPLPSLIEKTSMLYRYPRNDDGLSIRVLTQDTLPMMSYGFIKILRFQDKEPYVYTYMDENGQLLLNEKQIDYFEQKEVSIYVNHLGFTETEKKTLLEKGYDYIIISRIPTKLSGNIATNNKWKIHQINEDEISIGTKRYIIKLKKMSDNYFNSDFPFDKEVSNIED